MRAAARAAARQPHPPAGLPLRVPVPCACSDGSRKATSVRYVARAGDTLASVAGSVYAGLTTADWIRDSNGMPEGAALEAGTTLFVRSPCPDPRSSLFFFAYKFF